MRWEGARAPRVQQAALWLGRGGRRSPASSRARRSPSFPSNSRSETTSRSRDSSSCHPAARSRYHKCRRRARARAPVRGLVRARARQLEAAPPQQAPAEQGASMNHRAAVLRRTDRLNPVPPGAFPQLEVHRLLPRVLHLGAQRIPSAHRTSQRHVRALKAHRGPAIRRRGFSFCALADHPAAPRRSPSARTERQWVARARPHEPPVESAPESVEWVRVGWALVQPVRVRLVLLQRVLVR
jgi:hypothetical protein